MLSEYLKTLCRTLEASLARSLRALPKGRKVSSTLSMLASCQLLWNPTACSLVTAKCLSIDMLCLAGEEKEEKKPAAKIDAKVCARADICSCICICCGECNPCMPVSTTFAFVLAMSCGSKMRLGWLIVSYRLSKRQ